MLSLESGEELDSSTAWLESAGSRRALASRESGDHRRVDSRVHQDGPERISSVSYDQALAVELRTAFRRTEFVAIGMHIGRS
jgi:hypothetical protein